MPDTFTILDNFAGNQILAMAGIDTFPMRTCAERATAYLATLPADEAAKLVVQTLPAKPKHRKAAKGLLYSMRQVQCDKCGRWLSDPDSVAAGVGPTCQSV